MSRPDLTTTSFAILGLLAIRPWSTYELAQQMDRSLGRLWPRAASKIYEEPKKLVRLGLATARSEPNGRRNRTVYQITARGRRALRNWLAEPAAPPQLESEQLLKVFFAEHGTRDDVAARIDDVHGWALAQLAEHVAVGESYLAGAGPFPERAPVLLLTGGFLLEFADMARRWSEWAAAIAASWPEDVAAAPLDRARMEELVRRARAAVASEAQPARS